MTARTITLQSRQQGRQSDLRRREAEARYWLKEGYTNEAKVNELMPRIAAKRGQAAADQLRQDMRDQWRIRATWWEGAPL